MSDPRLEREERLAYFDDADRYTPYLAATVGGVVFLVKTEDKHIARSLFSKQGRGEFSVLGRAVGALEGLIGADAVNGRAFVDVGANIGTTTVPALCWHGFQSAVAIEPEPENVRVLRLNALLNDLEDRIAVLPVAVSNQVGRSELVVNRTRGGKHWIATDSSKLRRKSGGPDTEIVTVETVTLDSLAESGAIDVAATGLIWMDAEAHEGHILEGASALLQRGTPLVLEWNPGNLDRAGDRDRLQQAVADNYTHFAGMHREQDPLGPGFPLQSADRLPAYAERFLDPSNPANKTDILVVRLEPGQSEGVESLDAMVKGSFAYVDAPEPPRRQRRRWWRRRSAGY